MPKFLIQTATHGEHPLSNPDIQKFVARLWQYARMRAVNAPDELLRNGVTLIRGALIGFDPIKDKEAIAGEIYAHILEQTSKLYGSTGCMTCRYIGQCEVIDESTCNVYECDLNVFDSCREQLYKAVKFLDGAYGLQADKLVVALDMLLDDLMSSASFCLMASA